VSRAVLFCCAATVAAMMLTAAKAEAAPSCRNLPAVAWQQPPSVDLSLLGLASVSVDSVTSVKALYLQTLCGLQPATIWDLVDHGKGAVFELPANIATALDNATPYFPRVDRMYVRGGGPGKELAVILFANGYEGALFKVDKPAVWTADQAQKAGDIWNLLPYEYMRRAATWLHDVAQFDSCYTVEIELKFLFGLVDVKIPTGQKMCNRAMANPLGSMLMPTQNLGRGADVFVHELAHYNNWYLSGPYALALVDEFASISRKNTEVLGVPVPMLFEERYPQAKAACPQNGCTAAGGCSCMTAEEPYGYVSRYAACGEAVVEDFGDTLAMAVGITQGVWRNDHVATARVAVDNYRGNICNADGSYDNDYDYNKDRVFGRNGVDKAVMDRKVQFLRDHYTFALTAPMDADGDGVTWRYGDPRGVGDCDDANPSIGACDVGSCVNADDCNDGDPCTTDSCDAGRCAHPRLDVDGDGFVAASCGGNDCDDNNRFVNPGQAEICDGLDNDCNGTVDGTDALDARDWYFDGDHDGWGGGVAHRQCGTPGPHWLPFGGDCNDTDPAYHPGATESCTSPADYNCDGNVQYADKDGDGVPACLDCNDNDPHSYPGAPELCDGRDNNCNGTVDEFNPGGGGVCSTGLQGQCSAGVSVCQSGRLICNPTVRPGQVAETCDGSDNDCDGVIDNGVQQTLYRDADGDGFGDANVSYKGCAATVGWVTNKADCFDRNANARPGQTGWFDQDRGDGSYDYDCDGLQMPRASNVAITNCEFDACHWAGGWQNLVAECGRSGKWLTGCWGAVWVCTQQDWADKMQDCR